MSCEQTYRAYRRATHPGPAAACSGWTQPMLSHRVKGDIPMVSRSTGAPQNAVGSHHDTAFPPTSLVAYLQSVIRSASKQDAAQAAIIVVEILKMLDRFSALP